MTFTHADGDLDVELLSSAGARLHASEGSGNSETVTKSGLVAGYYYVRVFGYNGDTNSYKIAATIN